MKRAIFVRHAKSSWKFPELRDIERPLNKRGLRDGPIMASKMAVFSSEFEEDPLIVTSPANRALSTARFFAAELKIPFEDIQIVEDLYMASRREVIDVLESLDADSGCVYMFGHNPTQTSLINFFGKDVYNVPTCGAFVVDSEADSWSEFTDAPHTIKAYFFPKMFV